MGGEQEDTDLCRGRDPHNVGNDEISGKSFVRLVRV